MRNKYIFEMGYKYNDFVYFIYMGMTIDFL